jgi:hypothetical protein
MFVFAFAFAFGIVGCVANDIGDDDVANRERPFTLRDGYGYHPAMNPIERYLRQAEPQSIAKTDNRPNRERGKQEN